MVVVWLHILGPYRCLYIALLGCSEKNLKKIYFVIWCFVQTKHFGMRL